MIILVMSALQKDGVGFPAPSWPLGCSASLPETFLQSGKGQELGGPGQCGLSALYEFPAVSAVGR